jgi:hypothetical protein
MSETYGEVSWSRLIGAVHNVHERLRRSTRAFAEAAIPYAVVGGHAVAAWVATVDESAIRNTPNVELLVRRDDLHKVAESVHKVGFTQQGIADGFFFADRPAARRREMLRLWMASEPLPGAESHVAPDADEIAATAPFNLPRVLALYPLVGMMLATYTIVDRVAVRDLIDVGLIDSTWPARFPKELADRLQELLDTPDG